MLNYANNAQPIPGPIRIVARASTATMLQSVIPSGIPETADADANPYTTSGGQTVTDLLTGNDFVSQNVGGMKTFLGPWIYQNMITSLSSSAINVASTATAPEISVPYAGSILGLVCNVQTHFTAGGATAVQAWVSKNGTTIAGTKITFGTAAGTLYKATLINKDVTTLAAGDRIGVKVTTAASMSANTQEFIATVWIEQ